MTAPPRVATVGTFRGRRENIMGRRDAKRAEPMTKLIEEAAGEALGTSKKKWALVVAAFIAGAVVVLRLQARARREDTDVTPVKPSDAAPSDVESVPTVLTKMNTSNQRVRDELNRWTRLPMTRWQNARHPAGSQQSSPAYRSEDT
jgi:hypothetical protein